MTTCKLAIFTLFSTLLTAQTAYPCGTKDANWSFSEVAAWEQICLTGQAVLNGASLRSPFLRQIITEAQYTVSTTVKGVSIDNATLLGDTDLSNLTFDGQLSILNSKFTGYLKLNDSKFSRSLS